MGDLCEFFRLDLSSGSVIMVSDQARYEGCEYALTTGKDGYTETDIKNSLHAKFDLLVQANTFKARFDEYAKSEGVKVPGT